MKLSSRLQEMRIPLLLACVTLICFIADITIGHRYCRWTVGYLTSFLTAGLSGMVAALSLPMKKWRRAIIYGILMFFCIVFFGVLHAYLY